MATKLELLQEANRRGLLSPDKASLLKEAQSRGLIGGGIAEQPQEQPQEESLLKKIGSFGIPKGGSGAIEKIGQFAQGISAGFGNALVGGFQAATDLGEAGARKIEKSIYGDILNQETIGTRLAQGVKKRKADQSNLPAAEQVGIFAGESVPYLTSGLGTGAKVATALGGKALAKAVGAGAAGAVGGGAIGALSQQEEAGLEGRGKEAAQSAAIGLLAGGSLSSAGQLISKGGQTVKSLFKATKPEDILARRLPAGQTAELLEQLKTATPDSPVLLPDIAGDEVQGLTRAVGKLSGGKDIISDALNNRSKGAVTRVVNQLSKDISSVDTYFGNLDDIAKARSELSAPLYKRAYEEGTEINRDKLQKLLQDKRIIDAIDVAKKDFGVRLESPSNSLETLDGVKKVLDDTIGEAIRAGKTNKAGSFLNLKSQLLNELDSASSSYKKARQVFSDFSSIKKSQEQGLQFSKLRPEELRRYMSNLSVSEKEAFRIGVRENLQKTVTSTSEGADPAKRIFGNTFKRDQLKAIFPSQTKFKEFERKMIEETKTAETKFKVLGGSRTDINLAAEGEFLSNIAKTGGAVATGGKLPMINAAISSIRNKFGGISEKNAKRLATILVNRKESIKLLEGMMKKEQAPVQKRLIGEFIESIRPDLLITKGVQE